VANCTTVFVRKPGNPKKWQAEVVSLGLVCDLALITVKDDAFWDQNLMSLKFSDVPELQVSSSLGQNEGSALSPSLKRVRV
jgi:hypothetical protein